jgi:uncharacterized protein YjiS (DUF1127 family)
MSPTILAAARVTVPGQLALRQAAAHLAEAVALAFASAVLRRAERQAQRELAALDDRTLADIGLVRAQLTSLEDAFTETRAAAALGQFPTDHSRLGA